jgi:hypothetical protein
MTAVGRTIAFICHVSGWFVPMWGAGRLEAQNIVEYEHAARLAHLAGFEDWVEEAAAPGRGGVGPRAVLPLAGRVPLAVAGVPELAEAAAPGGDP